MFPRRRLPRFLAPAVLGLILALPSGAAPISAPPPRVNVRSEASVKAAYRQLLTTGNATPGWTGNVAAGNAGTVSAAYTRATLRAVNIFRALAGLTPVTFDPALNAKCAQAALIMSANRTLTHSVPGSFTFFSPEGAEAAAKSNLFLGLAGPRTIPGYIDDAGTTNTAVGHRRWILFPRSRVMGSGDVLGDASFPAANALWVLPAGAVPPPEMRDGFVAWPYPGAVPHTLVYRRWSFSLPEADLRAATVRVKRGTRAVSARIVDRDLTRGMGENTLVFEPRGRYTPANFGSPLLYPSHHAKPSRPVTYSVRVSNVKLPAGARRTFTYNVRVFVAP